MRLLVLLAAPAASGADDSAVSAMSDTDRQGRDCASLFFHISQRGPKLLGAVRPKLLGAVREGCPGQALVAWRGVRLAFAQSVPGPWSLTGSS